eukprot:8433-Heterococcus_DN1.PRE.4
MMYWGSIAYGEVCVRVYEVVGYYAAMYPPANTTHCHAVVVVAEGAGEELLGENTTEVDASGNKKLPKLAQNAVHAAMAGYTAFTVGLVNNKVVLLPIDLVTATSPRRLDPYGRVLERVLSTTLQPSTVQQQQATSAKVPILMSSTALSKGLLGLCTSMYHSTLALPKLAAVAAAAVAAVNHGNNGCIMQVMIVYSDDIGSSDW